MKPEQLKRTLQYFLEGEQISLDSGIATYITYALAGIAQENKTTKQQCFSFSTQAVTFSVRAQELSLPELDKLLAFFEIPRDSYHPGTTITLPPEFIERSFLPQFKAYFARLKQENPCLIVKYKVASASILESTALNTLTQYLNEAKNILLKNKELDLSGNDLTMYTKLSTLQSLMKDLRDNPLFYKAILQEKAHIEKLFALNNVTTNRELSSKLRMIIEGIDLFGRYHRNESVLALMKYEQEIKKFLAPRQIAADDCDVIEHSILSLAGAELLSNSECNKLEASDRARFVLRFGNINQENTKKIVDYLQGLGDTSACEGYGSMHYGAAIAESACERAVVSSISSLVRGEPRGEKKERHAIEMDGAFFYNTLFPLIKQHIEQMSQATLAPYQELSQDTFISSPMQPLRRVSGHSMFPAYSSGNIEKQPSLDHQHNTPQ